MTETPCDVEHGDDSARVTAITGPTAAPIDAQRIGPKMPRALHGPLRRTHDADDPWLFYANPEPPVEFYARGVDVPIAWPGGGTAIATGKSFAAPHVSAFLALVRSKHPGLTPFDLKAVLYRVAANARRAA